MPAILFFIQPSHTEQVISGSLNEINQTSCGILEPGRCDMYCKTHFKTHEHCACYSFLRIILKTIIFNLSNIRKTAAKY